MPHFQCKATLVQILTTASVVSSAFKSTRVPCIFSAGRHLFPFIKSPFMLPSLYFFSPFLSSKPDGALSVFYSVAFTVALQSHPVSAFSPLWIFTFFSKPQMLGAPELSHVGRARAAHIHYLGISGSVASNPFGIAGVWCWCRFIFWAVRFPPQVSLACP